MEKILLVVFGRDWSENTAELACYLAAESRAKLSGIFLEEPAYAGSPKLRQIGGTPYVETITGQTVPGYIDGIKKTEQNIDNFQLYCDKKVTVATVKRLSADELHKLTEESRFADLLIIDPAAAVTGTGDVPSPVVQTLLHNAQCPVLISPKYFTCPGEIVFCYDGSLSAITAMKLFTYIFPEFTDMKATVVKVNRRDRELPGETGILNAWLSRHYAFTDVVALKGDVEEELDIYLMKKKSPLLVMGAYGRSTVSRMLRRSHADYIMEVINCPIFITHH